MTDHDPTCTWCPLCQLIGLLRGERPDLAERLTEAGTAFLQAAQALVESFNATHPDAAEPTSPPARPVQKIHLT